MTALHRLLRDLRAIMSGALRLGRCLVSGDPVDAGLGRFTGESSRSVRGRPNRYTVRIASLASEPRAVRLCIDVYAAAAPRHPDGHLGYFSKSFTLKPRSAITVTAEYDWCGRARFVVGRAALAPDDLWQGDVGTAQWYSVTALLQDQNGRTLDRATLYQELTG